MTAERLRKMLETEHISQSELAEMLDYSVRTINRYANGVEPIPRVVEYALRYLFRDWPNERT